MNGHLVEIMVTLERDLLHYVPKLHEGVLVGVHCVQLTDLAVRHVDLIAQLLQFPLILATLMLKQLLLRESAQGVVVNFAQTSYPYRHIARITNSFFKRPT